MSRIKPKIRMNSDKTIRTFMIGTIELLETSFGELWDHGKDEQEMTDEEYEKFEQFLEIRERVLDLGNDLINTKAYQITEKDEQGKIRRKIYGN